MEPKINLFDNISSIFILNKIFSFLDESKKLELLSYNKQLQNKINISIDDYKNITGNYRIIEDSEKGKEYTIDSDCLIFEGEYKNLKRNGKGKEYYTNRKLKFEGEYLKGKKITGKGYDNDGHLILLLENNKGKELYNNGKIKFAGEYLNGRKWNGKGCNYKGYQEYELKYGNGKIKEYVYYGNLKFEGII